MDHLPISLNQHFASKISQEKLTRIYHVGKLYHLSTQNAMQIPLLGHKSQTANISILAVSFRAPRCAYFQSKAGPFLILYPLLKLNIRFSKDEMLSFPMTPTSAGQADAGTQCQELQDSCFARRDSPPPDSLHQSRSLGFQKIKYISLFSPLNVRPYVSYLFLTH